MGLVPGINLFLGANGQGKTNVVEAIIFLAYGISHRTHLTAALIRRSEATAVIVARFSHHDREITVDAQLERTGSTRVRVNGNAVRWKDLSRHLHVVPFVPEDLRLIRDEPEVRRSFFDHAISVITPRMASVFSDYERVLKQRNSLLKSLRLVSPARRDDATLDLWDDKLCQLAGEITEARLVYVDRFATPLRDSYRRIAGAEEDPAVALSSRQANTTQEDPLGEANARAFALRTQTLLKDARADDIERGSTSIGPHRDDFSFILNGLPVKGYASHGETWTFALALKLALAEVLRNEPLGDPIIILDDVFAELDEARRTRLANAVSSYEQVIITAAVSSDVPSLPVERAWLVDAGQCTMMDTA